MMTRGLPFSKFYILFGAALLCLRTVSASGPQDPFAVLRSLKWMRCQDPRAFVEFCKSPPFRDFIQNARKSGYKALMYTPKTFFLSFCIGGGDMNMPGEGTYNVPALNPTDQAAISCSVIKANKLELCIYKSNKVGMFGYERPKRNKSQYMIWDSLKKSFTFSEENEAELRCDYPKFSYLKGKSNWQETTLKRDWKVSIVKMMRDGGAMIRFDGGQHHIPRAVWNHYFKPVKGDSDKSEVPVKEHYFVNKTTSVHDEGLSVFVIKNLRGDDGKMHTMRLKPSHALIPGEPRTDVAALKEILFKQAVPSANKSPLEL